MKDKPDGGRPPASFIAGCIALLFLIIGYQSALFIRKASVARIVANHDRPETVFVQLPPRSGTPGTDSVPKAPAPKVAGRTASHSPAAESIREANTPRRYESFPFDPNTVSVDDLMRLGFSRKQAQSIDNYRQKGGRYRRKTDFARSYVVEDSVYRRLEPFIDIPLVDINNADTSLLRTLPGIGKFYAGKIVSYRKELGGYSYPEQLMDIWNFDRKKYDGLKDLIKVGPSAPFPLWILPEDSLAAHPYIGKRAAHGIVIFRENSPREEWTVENLRKAGILGDTEAGKLSGCRIMDPTP